MHTTKLVMTILPAAMLLAVACQEKAPEKPRQTQNGNAEGAAADQVTYDNWAQTFLTQSCTSCHGSGGKPNLPDLSTYEAASAGASASLIAMQAGTMPQGGPAVSADALAKMQAWISGGMLKTAAAPAGTGLPTTAKVTYNNWAKAYLNGTCATSGCHTANSTSPDLSTYAAAKAAAQASLSAMNSNMPYNGARPTADQLAKMQAWITDGLLEDDLTSTQPGTSTGTVGSGITYDGQIHTLLQTYCLGCHGAGATPPDLSTKDKAINVNDLIRDSIYRGTMPKGTTMSQSDKTLIDQWANTGAR